MIEQKNPNNENVSNSMLILQSNNDFQNKTQVFRFL